MVGGEPFGTAIFGSPDRLPLDGVTIVGPVGPVAPDAPDGPVVVLVLVAVKVSVWFCDGGGTMAAVSGLFEPQPAMTAAASYGGGGDERSAGACGGEASGSLRAVSRSAPGPARKPSPPSGSSVATDSSCSRASSSEVPSTSATSAVEGGASHHSSGSRPRQPEDPAQGTSGRDVARPATS